MRSTRKKGFLGYALILGLVAFAATVGVPRYLAHVAGTREDALREQLLGLRAAIDHYYGENRVYPASLDELVTHRYLRLVPRDPITDRSDSWQVTVATVDGNTGVYDVHSGASGTARDGTTYASW